MAYDFSPLKARIAEVKEWLAAEYTAVRTGRATPSILDTVKVESYGSRMPIAHVATVSVEDATTLRITPWDKDQIKGIEQAVRLADLGLGVAADGMGLRITFPMLTGERRTALVKIVRSKLEEARVSLRKEREEVWGDIQKKQKDGEMGEDEKFRLKDDMQALIDAANTAFGEMAEKKEKELEN